MRLARNSTNKSKSGALVGGSRRERRERAVVHTILFNVDAQLIPLLWSPRVIVGVVLVQCRSSNRFIPTVQRAQNRVGEEWVKLACRVSLLEVQSFPLVAAQLHKLIGASWRDSRRLRMSTLLRHYDQDRKSCDPR